MIHNSRNEGQLLLGILVAISALAIIITLGAQLVYVGLRSQKSAGDINTGLGLAEETFEAVRGSTTENWQNIFGLTKGTSTTYHPEQSGGKWILVSGSENISLSGVTYTRYFTIQNVCRDTTTGGITGVTDTDGSTTTCTESGGSHDPSMQRASVTVDWLDGDTISLSEYFSRWRNKVCLQTSWASMGGGVGTCPVTTYDSSSNITTGSSLEICGGGC